MYNLQDLTQKNVQVHLNYNQIPRKLLLIEK